MRSRSGVTWGQNGLSGGVKTPGLGPFSSAPPRSWRLPRPYPPSEVRHTHTHQQRVAWCVTRVKSEVLSCSRSALAQQLFLFFSSWSLKMFLLFLYYLFTCFLWDGHLPHRMRHFLATFTQWLCFVQFSKLFSRTKESAQPSQSLDLISRIAKWNWW